MVKFDPEGDYVRQWIPELVRLLTERIDYHPWHSSWATGSWWSDHDRGSSHEIMVDSSEAFGTNNGKEIDICQTVTSNDKQVPCHRQFIRTVPRDWNRSRRYHNHDHLVRLCAKGTICKIYKIIFWIELNAQQKYRLNRKRYHEYYTSLFVVIFCLWRISLLFYFGYQSF